MWRKNFCAYRDFGAENLETVFGHNKKVDFGGFWICYSTKNSDSNGINIPFFSGFDPSTARLYIDKPVDTGLCYKHRK